MAILRPHYKFTKGNLTAKVLEDEVYNHFVVRYYKDGLLREHWTDMGLDEQKAIAKAKRYIKEALPCS